MLWVDRVLIAFSDHTTTQRTTTTTNPTYKPVKVTRTVFRNNIRNVNTNFAYGDNLKQNNQNLIKKGEKQQAKLTKISENSSGSKASNYKNSKIQEDLIKNVQNGQNNQNGNKYYNNKLLNALSEKNALVNDPLAMGDNNNFKNNILQNEDQEIRQTNSLDALYENMTKYISESLEQLRYIKGVGC